MVVLCVCSFRKVFFLSRQVWLQAFAWSEHGKPKRVEVRRRSMTAPPLTVRCRYISILEASARTEIDDLRRRMPRARRPARVLLLMCSACNKRRSSASRQPPRCAVTSTLFCLHAATD